MHHRVKVIKNWSTKLTSWWQSWVERLPLPFIWNSLSEIIMQIYSFSKTQRYLLYASISFSQDDVHAHVHLVSEGKQLFPLSISVYAQSMYLLFDADITHQSELLKAHCTCTLYLSVSIFFVLFSYTGLIFFISFVQDASRNSVCHTATVIANSYMHCGTTSDTFLRYAIN